jgi:hypothetical protein
MSDHGRQLVDASRLVALGDRLLMFGSDGPDGHGTEPFVWVVTAREPDGP